MATAAECPACEETISLQRKPQIGDTITCPHCDTELEVIALNPIELDWAEVDDDWDEDDDWDDEEEEEEDWDESF